MIIGRLLRATITATSNGHEASCKVTVVAAPAQIQIAGTINVIKGRVVDIPATVVNTDGDVCETTLSLSTSNKKYVAVSGTQIKGVRAGSATVTVHAYNGVSARVKVVVWEKPTKAILDKSSISIGEGMTDNIRARIYYKKKSFIYSNGDANGIGQFSTGDTSIATVDSTSRCIAVSSRLIRTVRFFGVFLHSDA